MGLLMVTKLHELKHLKKIIGPTEIDEPKERSCREDNLLKETLTYGQVRQAKEEVNNERSMSSCCKIS